MIEGLWEKANKVSEIGYKLDSIAGIAELVAERLTDNTESGACWTVAEMLREYGERLEMLAGELMALPRINEIKQELQADKLKGKKK